MRKRRVKVKTKTEEKDNHREHGVHGDCLLLSEASYKEIPLTVSGH